MRLRYQNGFALPTVVITSVVMFAILAVTLGMTASTVASLNTQYYEELAADAAESGAAQADSCLQANGYTSTWGSKSLTPATNCAGNVVSGQRSYVVSTPTYTSTYTVAPVSSSGTGTQTATITGTVSLTRSSGVVWQSYTKSLIVKTGGQIGTNQVVFGYNGGQGAFFGTVGGDGIMRTVGYNGLGNLGNGTFNDTLTPTVFQAPTVNPIVAGFSNFLSVGFRMYAIDSAGNAYGAGTNGYGSLGVGIAGPQVMRSQGFATPKQVLIPSKKIRNVIIGQVNSYFITTDNNIYAAGGCMDGRLGSNYAIAGCADQATPVRVNLPTPNVSNPNTIPTDNFVTDRGNVYIRMAGGAVYGWGLDDRGQLGNQTFTSSSTPVKIGTYGDSGQPKATQIAFDGDALYVLDNSGHVSSIGYASYGNMGNTTMSLQSSASGNCLANYASDGVRVGLWQCKGTSEQLFQLRSNNTVYNADQNVCLDNYNQDGTTLQFHACNGTVAQVFVWDPTAGTLYNPNSGKCVDNAGADGKTIRLYTCNGSAAQRFMGYNGDLTPFDMSGMSGTITKIWTDQWTLECLTSNGEVWGAGLNNAGQLGNGTNNTFQPQPVQFNIPVPATDIYETYSSGGSPPLYQNMYAVGSNGKVYGAGSNTFGQLGNGTTSAFVKTPVAMSVINGTTITATQVQSGFGTTVIFTTNGSVYTVGNNGSGQLGDGTTNNSSVPIKAKYVNNLKATTY